MYCYQAPEEPERLEFLQRALASKHLAPDVSIATLARRTAALVAIDLDSLVTRASLAAVSRIFLTMSVHLLHLSSMHCV